MSETPAERDTAQHEAMGRVRELHERDRTGREAAAAERPWYPRLAGLVLAIVVVSALALGLDAFLSAVQRLLDMPPPEAPAAPAAPADAPMPVYVVPNETPAETVPADR